MKILVTGASGLVGSRFVELSPQYTLLTPEYPDFDLTNQFSLKQYLKERRPDLILNFAAFTDVGAAQDQTGAENNPCWQINVNGVANLLQSDIPLIHISTDMVFSGSEEDPGPYAEDHPTPDDPAQLTWYGWTKNRAERLVLNARQTIVRIIYPVRAHYALKKDYLHLPLSLFSQGKLYPLFTDQQVSLTFIDELVEALHRLIDRKLAGIFHVSSNTFSPYELVSYTVEKLGGNPTTLRQGSLRSFIKTQKNPHRYPLKGGLLTAQTEKTLGLKFRSWQQVVDELIKQGLSL